MKTKIVGSLVCSVLIITSFSLVICAQENKINLQNNLSYKSYEIISQGNEDILDQYNDEISGDLLVDSATYWKYAQSFIPSFTILTKIEIYMYKSGNGGWNTYTAEIKNTINGGNLTYVTKICRSFPYKDNWIEFDFPDINVVPGQTYYIVLSPDGCLWSFNYYLLLYYGNPDPYSRGEAWHLLERYQLYNPDDENWDKFEVDGSPADFCFKTYGINLPPNKPSKPNGKLSGEFGQEYSYSTSAADPEQKNLWYWYDWGDGTNTSWLGPYNSSKTCEASHIWAEEGSYSIRVKAKDEFDSESPWSDPVIITMPKNKSINTHILRNFEKLLYILFSFKLF